MAHECIIDLRAITKATGVTVDDVAKRLIDYGFHAPTMSFPVSGTLMIEPTESEDLAELDRFADAMIAIAGEIAAVADGTWELADSPLRQAPTRPKRLPASGSAPTTGGRACSRTARSAPASTGPGGTDRRRVRRPEPLVRLPAVVRLRVIIGRGPGRVEDASGAIVH